MGLSIGRYRIVERIAAGGMGEVYRAYADAVSGVSKEVALKVLLPELASREDAAALFVEEMKIALTLSHANVVQTFDVGRIDDRYFLAMELVDGTTLADLIDVEHEGDGPALSDRHAVTIAVEALKGLDYAHRRCAPDGQPLGLVHRDVSPQNVLVSREGEVKVADFGIAKSRLRSFQSMAGTIAGKIEYMAPEQLRGEAVDRRADVWSMGVVLFEMLTGQRPFLGVYPDIVPLVVEGRRPRLADLRPDAPERLARVVERALLVDREGRYANAAAMRQELEEVAVAQGWMLSVPDLAERVHDVRARDPRGASRRVAATGWGEDPSSTDIDVDLDGLASKERHASTRHDAPTSDAEATDDPFDAILGRQLERLEVTNELSVYRTATGLAAPPRAVASVPYPKVEQLHLEVERAAAPVRSPAVRRRSLGSTVAIALGVLLAFGVVGGVWWNDRRNDAHARDAIASAASVSASHERTVDREPAPTPMPTPMVADVALEDAAVAETASDASVAAPVATKRRPSDGRTERPSSRDAPAPTAGATDAALLSVNTDPWSNVYVDGRMVRATPLLRHRLTSGRHRVVVRNPGLGLERSMSVDLAPGEHRRITFDLR